MEVLKFIGEKNQREWDILDTEKSCFNPSCFNSEIKNSDFSVCQELKTLGVLTPSSLHITRSFK